MLPDSSNSMLGVGRAGPLGMIPKTNILPEPIGWREFTITAADSGEWIGYSSGDIAYPPFNPPIGILSAQPAPGVELLAIYDDINIEAVVAILYGDYTSIAERLILTVDDESNASSNVSMFAGNTVIEFSGFKLSFADKGVYTAMISEEGAD